MVATLHKKRELNQMDKHKKNQLSVGLCSSMREHTVHVGAVGLVLHPSVSYLNKG